MSHVTGLRTSVIGVPKTIDGDLKNAQVATSFGFDTACKVMNIAHTSSSCLCSLQGCHGKHGLLFLRLSLSALPFTPAPSFFLP